MSESRASGKRMRDHRVDALRGAALGMMFVDHIPDNLLNRITLRNLGFCDAAEIFVLLAGFASMLAYGRTFERDSFAAGMGKLLRRCGKLYVYQVGMLLVSIAVITQWRHYHAVPVEFLEPELAYGLRSVWRAMTLTALPGNLNILPLYIVLLLCFPLIHYTCRISLRLAALLSGALWLLVNLEPSINLPNWFDPDGWYFDPFAWQFLFTIGAISAVVTSRRDGDLPRRRAVVALAWTYLAFSAIQAFPWSQWGLPNFSPLDIDPPLKTPLSPLRLIDVMAIFYLVQSSPLMTRFAASPQGQWLAVLGRHSLEVFAAGTLLDMLAKLLFATFGNGWALQIGVNVVGLGTLFGLARALDRRRTRLRAAAAAPSVGAPAGTAAGVSAGAPAGTPPARSAVPGLAGRK